MSFVPSLESKRLLGLYFSYALKRTSAIAPSSANMTSEDTPKAKLHDEILCEIFKWSLFHRPPYVRRADLTVIRFDAREAPLVFAHVNRQWRSAALAYRDLWTFGVAEIFSNREPVHIRKVVNVTNDREVQLWLNFDPERNESFFVLELKGVVSLLNVSLSVARLIIDNVQFSILSGLPSGLFPSLKFLSLFHHPVDVVIGLITTKAEPTPPIEAFDGVLSLTAPRLTRPLLAAAGQALLKLDWSRLVSIGEILAPPLPSASLSIFLEECFPKCTELVSLSTYTLEIDLNGHARTAVEIPWLKELWIHNAAASNDREMLIPDFLHKFTFPGLQHLIMNAFGEGRAPRCSILRHALDKTFSGARITTLDINIACSSKQACESLAQMLRAFPNVVTLILRMPIVYDRFFEVLTGDLYGGSPRYPAAIRSVLPNLRALIFESWGTSQESRGRHEEGYAQLRPHISTLLPLVYPNQT